MKRVYKYGTGQEIPEGAIYLNTIVEERWHTDGDFIGRLVWHYFLVEVKE